METTANRYFYKNGTYVCVVHDVGQASHTLPFLREAGTWRADPRAGTVTIRILKTSFVASGGDALQAEIGHTMVSVISGTVYSDNHLQVDKVDRTESLRPESLVSEYTSISPIDRSESPIDIAVPTREISEYIAFCDSLYQDAKNFKDSTGEK